MYWLVEARFHGVNKRSGEVEPRYRFHVGYGSNASSVVEDLQNIVTTTEQPVGRVKYTQKGPFHSAEEATESSVVRGED